MSIYHVTLDLVNPHDPDENGEYVYGVRHWGPELAIKSVVERATGDGYLLGDKRAPKAEKVGTSIYWQVGYPLCYGKVPPS